MGRRRGSGTAPPGHENIRLVLVEPRALLGVGVREVVDREPDMEIVGEVRSADDALTLVEETAPDVVLLDVDLQGATATDATRRLRRDAPESAIVVVGGGDDDASILEAVEVGAAAHVSQIAEPAELVATIRRVADGEDLLTDELAGRPDLVEKIIDAFREGYALQEEHAAPVLTARELEVLSYVADGMRNREIADRLSVSEHTVKNHLTKIMHTLGAPNRTQAVTYAVRQGWITLDDKAMASGPRPPTR